MYKSIKDIDRSKSYKIKLIYSDPLIKLKKYDGITDGVGASLDRNGYPVTGLCEAWKDANGVEHPGTRVEMEGELGLTPGTLKQRSAFWIRYEVRVGADEETFDLEDPHDLLKFLFASAQSIVATSKEESETSAKAEYVIYSDEDEASVRIKSRSHRKQAILLADKLDIVTMINILAVYGEIADATQPNIVIDSIDQKIEENAKKFLEIASDPTLVSQSLVRTALDKGVLTIKPDGVYHGDILVGYDIKTAGEEVSKSSKLEKIIRAKLSGDMDIIKDVLNEENKAAAKPAPAAPEQPKPTAAQAAAAAAQGAKVAKAGAAKK